MEAIMVQVKLRLQPELKDFLQQQARRNQSSMGSEIARAVRERKDKLESETRRLERRT